MFKKKRMALGVATGLLGVAGIVTTAQAVQVNPDGTGQILLYPYFNAHEGYVTNINLVNSTDETKAVKIRFREGKSSYDILDFNIYMSPQDVWAGNVRMSEDRNGAKVGSINTRDLSCTLPKKAAAACTGEDCESSTNFFGQDVYEGIEAADTLEGYVEVIEMGVVTDSNVQKGVLHTNGVPNNCDAIESAWSSGNFNEGPVTYDLQNDQYVENQTTVRGLSAPTGGLFGSSAVLNIEEGTAFAIDPVAIENYSTQPQHYRSDQDYTFLLPSLASGDVQVSNVRVKNSQGLTDMVETEWALTAEDGCIADDDNHTPPCGKNPYPVSHVLLASNIMNEYFLDPSGGYDGHTDWVVTFPMKKHGINSTEDDVSVSVAGVYDREETRAESDHFGFSPVLPVPEEETILSREVNVISFSSSDSDYDASRTVLSSHVELDLNVSDFVSGWARMNFTDYGLAEGFVSANAYGSSPDTYDENSHIYQGVPLIGFAALEGNVSENPNARFGDAIPHRIDRR